MLGLWSAAVFHEVDDSEYGLHLHDIPEDEDRDRKRQRRSIFFAKPESDSDEDVDDYGDLASHRHFDSLNGRGARLQQATSAVIPATPYAADPLSKGACLLTPSFPRRSSSTCLGNTSNFVAVYEEANTGFRHYMEDRSAAMTADGVAYLGIYDGHGGDDASTFLQRHLLPTIQEHLQPGCDVHGALTAAYMATNAAFRATGSIQGSTATTIILKDQRLIAANVGDSPAFVVKKSGEVYSVIQEHKIEGEEAARIAAQGVPIYRSPTGPAYMGTPDGTRWLNMSRAFGDFVYPAISCEPHVCSLDVSDGKYLVMGSDGLTEKWPLAEVAQYLTQLASDGYSLPLICRRLVERSLERGSTDNISCMVVDLEAFMLLHLKVPAPTKREAAPAPEADEQRPSAAAMQLQPTSSGEAAAREEREQGLQHSYLVSSVSSADDLRAASLRCEEDGAREENADVQQLLCEEEPSGLEQQPRVLCRVSVPVCAVSVRVSGAALACCAAKALGTSGADGARRQRVCGRSPVQESGVVEGTVEGLAGEKDVLKQKPPAALPPVCCPTEEAAGEASPTCSSPDVHVTEERLDELAEGEVLEGGRQATPQPMQTACRIESPKAAETAAGSAGDGSRAGAA